MGRILSAGDILEVECPAGVAYISYAGRDANLGDAIWVIPEVFRQPTQDWSTVFGRNGYFAFYPAGTALRRKLVRKVGYSTEALRVVPVKRRRELAVDDSGVVTSWLITDGRDRTPKRDSELTDEEKGLPIASIWNHPLLIERIVSGWMPGRTVLDSSK